MKTFFLSNAKGVCLLLGLALIYFTGYSKEHITLSLVNIASTPTTIEFDLVIMNDGNEDLKLSACSYGINYRDLILNGGNPLQNSFTFIPGTQSEELMRLGAYSLRQTRITDHNQLRITMTAVKKESSPTLAANIPYRVGRFRFENDKPWARNSNPKLSLNEFNVEGISTSCAIAYVNNSAHVKGFSVSFENLTCKAVNSPVLNASVNSVDNVQLNGLVRMNAAKSVGSARNQSAIAKEDSKISIYPNPTQDILNVDFQVSKAVTTLVKVLDISGRVVKQVQAHSEKGANSININLLDITNGMYTVNVYQDNELIFIDKLSKKSN